MLNIYLNENPSNFPIARTVSKNLNSGFVVDLYMIQVSSCTDIKKMHCVINMQIHCGSFIVKRLCH